MADVLPFPLARRRDLVWSQAGWFLNQGHRAAEQNLFRQMQVQRDTLLRKGVEPTRVEAEVRSLEGEIRAAVWRIVMTPGLGA